MSSIDLKLTRAGGQRWWHGLQPAPDSEAAANRASGISTWSSLIHLIWTAWIFITPLFNDHGFDRAWVYSTLLSLPILIGLYLASLLCSRQLRWWLSWAMLLLTLAVIQANPTAACCYYIFALLGSDIRELDWRGVAQYSLSWVLKTALFVLVAWSQRYPWWLLTWVVLSVLLMSIVIQFFHWSRVRAQRLRLSEGEVRRLAALAERERIGRDLHDLLGHSLTTISLKLELARRLADLEPSRSAHERDQAEIIARAALVEVRAAVTGIRAADLAAELAAGRLLLEPAGTALEHDPLPTDLNPVLERQLAMVLREALTNIARHARARHAAVRFRRQATSLQMLISDDGCGLRRRAGQGLSGMRERVEAWGGRLQLDSSPKRGTDVMTEWPLSSGNIDVAVGECA